MDIDEDFTLDSEDEQADMDEEARDEIALGRSSARKVVVNPCPEKDFQANLDKLADKYAKLVDKSEGPFTWDDIVPPKGEGFTDKQRRQIRQKARMRHPTVFPPVDKNRHVHFPASRVKATFTLPNNLLTATDAEQFRWLDAEMKNQDKTYRKKERRFGKKRKRYTWHHHQTKGKMQLVEMGVHDITSHIGGKEIWGGGAANR